MARSLRTHLGDVRRQAMYGVVHGGLSLELRQRSIDYLTSLPFDGARVWVQGWAGVQCSGRPAAAVLDARAAAGSRRRCCWPCSCCRRPAQ